MADIYKIVASWMGVWVHSGPGLRYRHVGVIYGRDNAEYQVTDRQNRYWIKIGEGRWACDRDSNGMIVMTKTGTTQAQQVPAQQVQPEPKLKEVDEASNSWIPDRLNVTSDITDPQFYNNIASNFTISNLRGIFGMPYQFMPSADPRVDESESFGSIGRKYAMEIVTYMPLLLMTPGKPVFMAGYNKKDKQTIAKLFVGTALEGKVNDNALSEIATKEFGKYYSLSPATNEYFEYVNPMCRAAAVYMHLSNTKVDGMPLGRAEWSKHVNSNFNKLFSPYYNCTAWYCDSDNSISDSFTNETTESMIASKVNSLSEYGRELNFLLGTASGITGVQLDKISGMENINSNDNIISQFSSKLSGYGTAGNIFSSLINSIQTVAAGGKIIFPELWSGSSFSRSYSIKLKFASPDGDDLSIYLNIIVPILHLLGFVLPRESTTSHGYISPFLVRAFYKGLFNVDMGIITDLNIEKGKEGAWTKSGIPTVVDVSFTIKDLYDDMYMSNKKAYRNIILMDYIGNLCGININEPDIVRGLNLFLSEAAGAITDTWHLKIFGSIEQYVNNKFMSIFGKF